MPTVDDCGIKFVTSILDGVLIMMNDKQINEWVGSQNWLNLVVHYNFHILNISELPKK